MLSKFIIKPHKPQNRSSEEQRQRTADLNTWCHLQKVAKENSTQSKASRKTYENDKREPCINDLFNLLTREFVFDTTLKVIQRFLTIENSITILEDLIYNGRVVNKNQECLLSYTKRVALIQLTLSALNDKKGNQTQFVRIVEELFKKQFEERNLDYLTALFKVKINGTPITERKIFNGKSIFEEARGRASLISKLPSDLAFLLSYFCSQYGQIYIKAEEQAYKVMNANLVLFIMIKLSVSANQLHDEVKIYLESKNSELLNPNLILRYFDGVEGNFLHHLIIRHGFDENIKILLKLAKLMLRIGVDIHQPNNQGVTTLLCAASYCALNDKSNTMDFPDIRILSLLKKHAPKTLPNEFLKEVLIAIIRQLENKYPDIKFLKEGVGKVDLCQQCTDDKIDSIVQCTDTPFQKTWCTQFTNFIGLTEEVSKNTQNSEALLTSVKKRLEKVSSVLKLPTCSTCCKAKIDLSQ